jgi:hypothetical protein
LAKKTTKKSTTAGTKRTATKRGAAKKTARKAAKRELISTGSDTRYVRRGTAGRFKESDDVGKASASDQRTKARTKAARGQGDKGDR